MKKFKVSISIISILLGLLLLGGCSNIFNSSAGKESASVTISISATGRTLMPDAPNFAFDRYQLTFTPLDEQTEPQNNPAILDSGNQYTLILEPGNWSVSVIGMIFIEDILGIDDGYYEIASSNPTDFFVGAGTSTSVIVTVRGGMQEGFKGNFSWDISFPPEVISGSLVILDVFEEEIDGIDPVVLTEDDLEQGYIAGTIELYPGYYFIKVELENDDNNKAYRTEIFHIHSFLTTTAGSDSGYAFTTESFAPMINISGEVLISTNNDLFQQGTIYLYQDAEYEQEITSIQLDESGTWTYRLSPLLYPTIYLKAEVKYTGFETLEMTKGPITVVSANATDFTIDIQVLQLTGKVILDTVEIDGISTLSVYSDAVYSDLIIETNIDTNGNWNVIILPQYTNIYLKAAIKYTDFEIFEWTKGPINVISTNEDDWIINTSLLHLDGKLLLDTPIVTVTTLLLFSDLGYKDVIGNAVVETNGNWNVVLLPVYTNIYMKATVQYTGQPLVERIKGPVNVSSANEADWIINCLLPNADIIIGDPTVRLYLNGTTLLENNGITDMGTAMEGIFTVSIDPGSYSEIRWFVNGNLAAQGNTRTSITLTLRNAGILQVTVEATPTGRVKNTGTHSFEIIE